MQTQLSTSTQSTAAAPSASDEAVASGSTSQSIPAVQQTENVFTQPYYQYLGDPGDHGTKYQIDLAFVLFVRGSLEQRKFKIATEMVAAETFDDIVFFDEGLNEALMIQVKHAKELGHVSCWELFPKSFKPHKYKDFNLYKYIVSYSHVQQNLKSNIVKKYFIFSNKSLEVREELREWVDIFNRDVDSLMDFPNIATQNIGFKLKKREIYYYNR